MSVTSEQRPKIGAMFRGPGPAKYLLPGSVGYSGHDYTKRKNPAYSFGIKGKKSEGNGATPGPGKYLVPSRQTRYGKDGTPAYTLHDRTALKSSFQTPGPGGSFAILLMFSGESFRSTTIQRRRFVRRPWRLPHNDFRYIARK